MEAIFAQYPDRRSAMLPVLWLAVRAFGWISPQVEQIVSEVIGQPLNEVHSVVTFYTMFPRRPVGRHEVQICRNISCWMAGSVTLLDHLVETLGIGVGETTSDGKFTLIEVECLAHCECAPAMRFDNRIIGDLTPDTIDKILAEAD